MDESTNKKETENTYSTIEISTEKNPPFEEKGEGQTMEELLREKQQDKKIKNLLALVVFLAGVLAGSLFIDFVQLFLGTGYSERALRKTDIFESGDKTWVAFSDPAVSVRILNLDDKQIETCPDCDPTEVLLWMKKFLPTLVVKKVSVDSAEGEKMLGQLEIKSLPAFIFDNQLKKTEFFEQAGVSSIFEEKNDWLVLNKSLMGIPVGKFLKFPEVSEEENMLGNKDGLKIIVFSDFQCPYSKKVFTSLQELMKEGYQEKVGLVLKNFPAVDIHPLANDAALTAFCANQQGKFWETASLIFDKQDQWSKAKNKDIFTSYFRTLGLDNSKMQECLKDEKSQDKILADFQQAGEFSLNGTPSGFIGEKPFDGVLEKEELKKNIDEQLQK